MNTFDFIPKQTIHFDGVSLCFVRNRQSIFKSIQSRKKNKFFWALKDISFSTYEGDTLGIIGRNGSGKSTIARLCSGGLIPDRGKINVRGSLQLLALGVGFAPDLTGKENVFISGALLGLMRKEIEKLLPQIVEFAELGDFINEPLRTYSNGMKSRLGFAISTVTTPEILILDEVLATGDAHFRQKALERLEVMRGKTKTVLLISHNPNQIRNLCNKAIWIEKGTILMAGDVEDIASEYKVFCKNPEKWYKNNPSYKNKVLAASSQ